MLEQKPKMRVVLLYTTGHIGSAIVLNRLSKSESCEIVGIVRCKTAPINKQGKAILKRLQKVGWHFAFMLFWQRCIQLVAYGLALLIPFARRRVLPGWKITQDQNIEVLNCIDINDQESEGFIKKCNPDIIVSAYFSQILKPNIFSIPKHGTFNIHPGFLPFYRGVMSYFWVLKNHEDHACVTVHYIEEGIDTGNIVAQKHFVINQGMTQHQVLVKTAVFGSVLMKGIIRKVYNQQPIEVLPTNEDEGAYYTMPQGEDFSAYFKQHRFFRIRDMLSTILKKTWFS